jgi:hypothetical protein
MESSTTKARESAAKYTSPTIVEPVVENKSVAIAPATNTLPAAPTDPTKLSPYIDVAENLAAAANAMKTRHGISKAEIEYWDKIEKTCALASLEAALRLSISINAIPTARGHKPEEKDISDAEISFETKKQILERDYGMKEKKAWKLARLTALAVDAEKARAIDDDEPVSIRSALSFVESQKNTRDKGRKNAAAFAAKRTNTTTKVLPDGKFDVIYMDIETARANQNLAERIADTAILFLWADPAELIQAIKCIEYFGFAYKDCAVAMADKVNNKSGFLQSNHRHLLVATKGEYPTPDCFRAPSFGDGIMLGGYTGVECFQKLIEKMYPGGAKLDLISETALNSTWTICETEGGINDQNH